MTLNAWLLVQVAHMPLATQTFVNLAHIHANNAQPHLPIALHVYKAIYITTRA